MPIHQTTDYDFVIVGGGFYGCCLALFLRTLTPRVLVIEESDELLGRASSVNQARIHTGFHYPRSFTTALRSRALQERFVKDFPHAVVNDFEMLYAIARRRSKVTAARFARMFQAIDAPIRAASQRQRGLFEGSEIEEVFLCQEFAFDWRKLREGLAARLHQHQVPIRMEQSVTKASQVGDRVIVCLNSGEELTTTTLFNVTYAGINRLALDSGLPAVPLKHEFSEVALVQPPPDLEKTAITVMDGPFFSTMPYPAERLYSLTHVRYTPHYSWVDAPVGKSPYEIARDLPAQSRWRHMVQDAQRYVPCLGSATYVRSLFDVKTVLIKNERDDGRPILLQRFDQTPNIIAVMGAKVDNIYDLFEILPRFNPAWGGAHTGLLTA